jgi:hypothetical protein
LWGLKGLALQVPPEIVALMSSLSAKIKSKRRIRRAQLKMLCSNFSVNALNVTHI